MLELEEAVARILKAMPAPAQQVIPLTDAAGHILLEEITAAVDLPVFDNSSMDGYAVRATDVAAATAEAPTRLRLVGRVAAGEHFAAEVFSGTCVRLFTGSPLPSGADAIVMQEDTKLETDGKNVLILEGVRPWENVRFRGEDVRKGAVLAARGDRLTAGRLCLLAASGVKQVPVSIRPRVGILATGTELREPGAELAPGQIYESNRVGLAALIREAGAIPVVFPLVPDAPDLLQRTLEGALGQCDALVTSGGVSVGELDFIKGVLEKAGGNLEFWRVAIKPGRPFAFGRYSEKFVFALPGNPVSALVTFLMLVRPALLRWQGALEVGLAKVPGRLNERLANSGSRRHFMRVVMDATGKVRSAGPQGSHMLSSWAAANGLLDVPPQTTLESGSAVEVLRWEL